MSINDIIATILIAIVGIAIEYSINKYIGRLVLLISMFFYHLHLESIMNIFEINDVIIIFLILGINFIVEYHTNKYISLITYTLAVFVYFLFKIPSNIY
ncbi:hypothetical protein [Streptobacillus moniliformis]|uniref:hypothetical protein n=1 Tax=Streptobacillus moniliformis TaxID=34105 RepID=UPI0007E4065F|nr:hypothetical protein [Streptobacillus moniliformis]